jgi:small GTP-binding protein
MSTLGVDVRFKSLQVDGKKIRLQIWDTAGQEVFRTIISAYYRGADAIVIVHDLTEPQTFEDI